MKKTFKLFFIICSLWGIASFVNSQTVETIATPGSGSWVCPPRVTEVTVECWGGGGAGGGGAASGTKEARGGGGAGGGYSKSTLEVVSGTTYNFSIGAGATGVVPTVDNEVAPSGLNTWFINA